MRDPQVGIDTVMERMARDRYHVLQAIDQSKRDVLLALREGDATIVEVLDATRESLATDLNFAQYVQVQAAHNAAAWANEDIDTI